MPPSISYNYARNLLIDLEGHVQGGILQFKTAIERQDSCEEKIDYIKMTLEHLNPTKTLIKSMDLTEKEIDALQVFLKDIEEANSNLKIYLNEALDGTIVLDKTLREISGLLAQLDGEYWSVF